MHVDVNLILIMGIHIVLVLIFFGEYEKAVKSALLICFCFLLFISMIWVQSTYFLKTHKPDETVGVIAEGVGQSEPKSPKKNQDKKPSKNKKTNQNKATKTKATPVKKDVEWHGNDEKTTLKEEPLTEASLTQPNFSN